jgi:hypothetical protein
MARLVLLVMLQVLRLVLAAAMVAGERCVSRAWRCDETLLLGRRFYATNDLFGKTGSGRTKEKLEGNEKERRFVQEMKAKIASTLAASNDLLEALVPSKQNKAERWRIDKKKVRTTQHNGVVFLLLYCPGIPREKTTTIICQDRLGTNIRKAEPD